MNAPTNADVAHATNRGNTRGRGRGGGRGNKASSTQRANAEKSFIGKIGPSRLLETIWVKDNVLKNNVFVFTIGDGTSASSHQWTFHRPIGETSLSERQWVATPTRDIHFLLQRRTNEALSAWERQRELAIRRVVLDKGTGRRLNGTDEVWSFDGAPRVTPTIKMAQEAAKAAGHKTDDWLDHTPAAVQLAERNFKEAMRTTAPPAAWTEANPRPAFQTMGGALGTVPQVAVEYLNGLSHTAAQDKVLRVVVGLDPADKLPIPPREERKTDSSEGSDVSDTAETDTAPAETSPGDNAQVVGEDSESSISPSKTKK